ncbi:MAG TPA: hypothetical protein VKU41_15330 [Polyangiaceae bacterium]|nr:hypothetical protein [Polyangiaceae bacterium]
MAIFFCGCRDVSITQVDPLAGGIDAPPMRFVIAGAAQGNGVYPGTPLGSSVHADGPRWSVTIQYQPVGGSGAWVDSPVQVTNTGRGTEIRAVDPGDNVASADLVLFCASCCVETIAPGHIPSAANATWVTWGVTVDGGGLSGHGPVPPWTPYVRELAAGLALADAANLVRSDLRSAVLALAAQQVGGAGAALTKALTGK